MMLWRNHHITLEDYTAKKNDQRDKCAICGKPETRISKSGKLHSLSVDHDHRCCPGTHSCGACIRGLLCSNCNLILGRVGDNIDLLRKLILYLEQFAPVVRGEPNE